MLGKYKRDGSLRRRESIVNCDVIEYEVSGSLGGSYS